MMAYLMHAGSDYRAAGVSTYARNLAEAMPIAPNAGHLEVFHGSDGAVLRGVTARALPIPTCNPALRIAWEQLGFPLRAAMGRFDVVHGTVNVVPFGGAFARVVTVHDLSFLRYPERFRASRARYLAQAVRASAWIADRIIAVSEHTGRDVQELLDVPEERVSVVPLGVASGFKPLPDDAVGGFARTVFQGRPFILHVGTLEPRKNLDVLIRAYCRLRKSHSIPHVLALVGARGWMYESLLHLVSELHLDDCVRFVDYVEPTQLPLWYNAAAALVYPSAYEGFGLPVVEAMACGAPVVTSDASSLMEVAGGASITVRPGSVEELEVALERVLTDLPLRNRLVDAGLQRASRYTWDSAAAGTWDVYRRALEERR